MIPRKTSRKGSADSFDISGHYHKRILENVSIAVLVLDQDLKVVYVNPAAEMLVKMSGNRLKGIPVCDIFDTRDKDFNEELSSTLSNEQPHTRRDAQFNLHDGDKLTADMTVSVINNLRQPSLMIELQTRDRLLRISREEQLLERQETAKILVRGLAHEIKNPLGGIRGAAQLLSLELGNPELQEYTRIIMEEADRLRNLVDRMLGSHKALDKRDTNIHEVLERVRNLISVESGDRIRLIRDYDISIPEILMDREQMIQAFLNIARNAMQALERTEKPSITFRSRVLRQFTIGQKKHRLVAAIEVIDNGPGIPDELAQNIFYPMISGRAEGSGLGLSITQSIISKHNGLVECDSEPGKTRFTVIIPLEQSK